MRNIHASLCCLVGFRNMFASTPWRLDAGWTCSIKTQRHLICFERMFTFGFNVLASSSEDASPLEPTSPNCREDRVRHPCCDHRDECAFQGSVVASVARSLRRCFLFAVLPANSLKHPHIWEPCRAHMKRVLVARSEVLRDGSIDTSAVHCPRRQVLHVAKLIFSFAPSHGLYPGCVTARSLFSTSVGFHPGSARLEFSLASDWQRVLRNRHRNRKMMTRSSSRCI